MSRPRLKAEAYISGIRAGERYVLSQAITLVESTLDTDQQLAERVLEGLLPYTGQSLRIGITGVPGVGKSTFINALGPYLISLGHRLAVLSVDPSSEVSRGSILGDKTRMPDLARQEAAYIRPSAAGSTLGGVARKTRESMLLCEAAGYDVILVETVGVGQSETLVHQMVDCFMLLLLAGAGDELQGIKRGIMEMADLLVITKADGANQRAAQQAAEEYRNALHLYPLPESGVAPQVLSCSAQEKTGLQALWQAVQAYQQFTQDNNYFEQKRRNQRLHWLHDTLGHHLKQLFYQHSEVQAALPVLEQQVLQGKSAPAKVARELISLFAAKGAQQYSAGGDAPSG
jgi:LAO/AO transport system kinase